MARYLIEGEVERPGDANIETFSLSNARSAFADLIAEGAKFVTLTEFVGPGTAASREIGRFTSFSA